ncbi:mycofactocin-coupled SDR family oxidoreductase [Rhodococcus rhodochrous]|uniref:mycofactocin-coupled SDR family oxidoreductase n=1 Tax=Rhodococcus rhodochrous TaxID=1829 RepID=UPI00119D3942|nr:mycofactocin-coupled SDR family oxidoreductase [Rhodococcus rhodochrous]TWH37458.1 SDR family mycofactocin-dependent oxidoreductase [Rhodococcus rhodochrous J38]
MTDFTNRVALVTGAARGQGRSHAVALAERGADLVICDRCEDSEAVAYPLSTKADLEETVRLVEATGRRCISVQADTADRSAIEALVRRAEEELGRIDIAIANAGVSAAAPVQDLPDSQWSEVIGTNLTGVFHTVAAVAPGMIERGYGRIVTIASMLGRAAAPAQAAYCASKWGVIGMTKSAALDLAPHGITVNAVAPGNISTPMVHNDALYRMMRPDLENPTRADIEPIFASLHGQPVPFLEPEEVTHAVLFLAAEASAHITGTVMSVDAGAAARVTA